MSDRSVTSISSAADPSMIDVVFDLDGSSVPLSYPFALWSEAVRCLPWLKEEANSGFLPLRGSVSDNVLLLSRRTKLVLRLPVALAPQAAQLSGQQIRIDGSILSFGQHRNRPLQPASTLHAYMVQSNLGEVEFLAEMKEKLQSMNISCNLICDKKREVRGENQILNGFGLVLHDLKPLASVQVQCIGLGGARHYGCGMFVPFKAISGLD